MGAADVNKDLVVSSDEIRNYVSENVILYGLIHKSRSYIKYLLLRNFSKS